METTWPCDLSCSALLLFARRQSEERLLLSSPFKFRELFCCLVVGELCLLRGHKGAGISFCRERGGLRC